MWTQQLIKMYVYVLYVCVCFVCSTSLLFSEYAGVAVLYQKCVLIKCIN